MGFTTRGAAGVAHPSVLVGTDIWLEFFMNARGHASRIAAVFDAVERKGGTLLCAFSSIQDLYYLLLASMDSASGGSGRRDVEEQVAWACLRTLRERATVVGADLGDVLQAEYLRSLHADLADCLLLAAAKRGRADYLLTERAELHERVPLPSLGLDEMGLLLGMEEDA